MYEEQHVQHLFLFYVLNGIATKGKSQREKQSSFLDTAEKKVKEKRQKLCKERKGR